MGVLNRLCARGATVPIGTFDTLPSNANDAKRAEVAGGRMSLDRGLTFASESDSFLEVSVELSLESMVAWVQVRSGEQWEARSTKIVVGTLLQAIRSDLRKRRWTGTYLALVSDTSNTLETPIAADVLVSEAAFTEFTVRRIRLGRFLGWTDLSFDRMV